ncbi:glutamate-5-semialdehyde dehydrogenase [Maridesulfovibrio hydrothermalis]|uniref:Gamma-glutamyl phosphate reductase n=1 Tax=Maridesulfovibrio hydrothermalis AM13 = DSM 14728 TaxID=1121451 RepID=L0R5W5_9BACT|nr:glutamate-5-semialdehyde dehydrogenase [Maridesulfovibrio hydrothermalis]CCO22078.1 Gamma-glutamyl phosphate reductase [Maridesulfovibrio hydrothermalis AM13 = DSM 14728]
MSFSEAMKKVGVKAKEASRKMSCAEGTARNAAIIELANLLEQEKEFIFAENRKDLDAANERGLDQARLQRLEITPAVLEYMIQGCNEVAGQTDPVGGIEKLERRSNGMMVGKMRIPLGVIMMIFESRPNVTIDAAVLCLKAGNSVVLRGGSEAIHSNLALASLLHKALEKAGLPAQAVQVVSVTDREAVSELLKLDEYIDVVIPRGGEGLIRAVVEQATMPVLKHYKGVCHIFVDKFAEIPQSVDIVKNAKTQKPGVCNALECLLVHEDIASEFLPALGTILRACGVTMKGCPRAMPLLGKTAVAADFDDWGQEFLDLTLAVKVVSGQNEAQDHIARYGSNHTEVILTKDHGRAMRFIREVDASLVGVNASTRFNDGGQLGLGAEIGISTSKLHSYGPMGATELTSTKFVLLGDWQVRN